MADDDDNESDDDESVAPGAVVWVAHHVGTQDGDLEYDDNGGYSQRGIEPHDAPGFYLTRAEARAACAALNADPNKWGDEFGQYGPFFDAPGEEWVWAEQVLLPWPQFCDWCKDHDVPRPGIDEGYYKAVVESPDPGAVQQALAAGPPDLDDMAQWYDEIVPVAAADEFDRLLAEVIVPRVQFVPQERRFTVDEIDQKEADLVVLRAALARPADPPEEPPGG